MVRLTVLRVRFRLLSLMWQTACQMVNTGTQCRVLLFIHSHLRRLCACVHVFVHACFSMFVRVTVHPDILNS